jgi:hypothetical protein
MQRPSVTPKHSHTKIRSVPLRIGSHWASATTSSVIPIAARMASQLNSAWREDKRRLAMPKTMNSSVRKKKPTCGASAIANSWMNAAAMRFGIVRYGSPDLATPVRLHSA